MFIARPTPLTTPLLTMVYQIYKISHLTEKMYIKAIAVPCDF